MAAAMGRRAGLGASKFPAPPYGRKLIFGSTLGLSAPETDRRVLGVLEWTCANFRVLQAAPSVPKPIASCPEFGQPTRSLGFPASFKNAVTKCPGTPARMKVVAKSVKTCRARRTPKAPDRR